MLCIKLPSISRLVWWKFIRYILLKTFTFGWQGLFSNFFGSRRFLFAATTCILWRFLFSLLGSCCKNEIALMFYIHSSVVILLFKNIGRMNNLWTEKELSSLIFSDYLNCFYLKTERIFIGLTIILNKAYKCLIINQVFYQHIYYTAIIIYIILILTSLPLAAVFTFFGGAASVKEKQKKNTELALI